MRIDPPTKNRLNTPPIDDIQSNIFFTVLRLVLVDVVPKQCSLVIRGYQHFLVAQT